MFCRQTLRFFHSNLPLWSSVNKSNLAKLRKKTGYTFANCKKALELNDNDVSLAEKWLKEQAQALGWSKATKLEGRATLQGLVGVTLQGNSAVMVEVNCETDFVARNKKFRSLVELTSETCLYQSSQIESSDNLSKVLLDSLQLRSIISPEGKSLADHSALAISTLGENMAFRRAMLLKSHGDICLAGYTHPSPENPNATTLTGKYGALIAYTASCHDEQIEQTARQLCQHIVGMDPVKIGVDNEDEPVENKDEESVMLHQDFLLDPTVTVGQLITDMGIKVIDFVRFECGEPISTDHISTPVQAASQAN